MTEKLEHCHICDPLKNDKPIVSRHKERHAKTETHKKCQRVHDYFKERIEELENKLICANENAKATAERRNEETNNRCLNKIEKLTNTITDLTNSNESLKIENEDFKNKIKSLEMENEQLKNDNQQQKDTIVYQAKNLAKENNNKIKKKKKKNNKS